VAARTALKSTTRTSAVSEGGATLDQDLKTYVLDTSVLLSDPQAFFRFAEHSIVLPVAVIGELEGKRHDPELGYFARRALRHLDELRVEHGRLDFPVPIGDGGTLRVELNNSDQTVLPSGIRLGDNDSRILAVAMHLSQDGQDVTVVSKDLPMRVKAASLGINAEEYLAEQAVDSGWTGISSISLSGDEMSDLYESEVGTSEEAIGLPVNTGLIIHSERGSALGRVTGDGEYSLVRGDREVFGLHGRSAEQRIATSASSRSAAVPVPASRPSHSARGWRRCWSGSSRRRSSCSVRCSPSAARSSATCPATRTRR